jgi:methionyl-tRNA formyltransferase
LIDWLDSSVHIERKIRAYYSWPKAFTFFNRQQLAITEACIVGGDVDETKSPGSVLGVDKQHGILVKTGTGILGLKRLQIQTKKEMDFKSFLNGYGNILNSTLGE